MTESELAPTLSLAYLRAGPFISGTTQAVLQLGQQPRQRARPASLCSEACQGLAQCTAPSPAGETGQPEGSPDVDAPGGQVRLSQTLVPVGGSVPTPLRAAWARRRGA